uniref:sel1 repeat family protein n=1 Tax=Ningiella ruwaisensis TaxID=2364274 RepID=UPI0010A02B58|nr:sel1 repeat family protein [Ningiella ruwaisensis]
MLLTSARKYRPKLIPVAALLFTCFILFLLKGSDNYSPALLYSQAQNINLDDSSRSGLLYQSAILGNENALDALILKSVNTKNSYWLEALAKHEYAEAAYQLALLKDAQTQQKKWFRKAAELGHSQSHFEMSLISTKASQRFAHLYASAQKDYAPAVITIARYFYQHPDDAQSDLRQHLQSIHSQLPDMNINQLDAQFEQQLHAKYWLEKAANYDGQSAYYLANIYYAEHQLDKAKRWLKQAVHNGFAPAENYLHVLTHYQIQPAHTLFSDEPVSASVNRDCAQTLQFVSTSLHSMVQAKAFKQRFLEDARFSELPICINDIAWLAPDVLNCITHEANNRISCNLDALTKIKKYPDFTHLVVFAPQGKAYVQRGVMYLDQADEYSVFIHELAHFAGFVDEYALSTQLAEMHCTNSDAPNLLVQAFSQENVNMSTSLMAHSKHQLWQELEGSLSLAPSRTCSNANVQSYKPSADITFLEHHDTQYIPDIYISLWRHQLDKYRSQMPFIYAFLHHLHAHADGSIEQSTSLEHWQGVLERHASLGHHHEGVQSTSP